MVKFQKVNANLNLQTISKIQNINLMRAIETNVQEKFGIFPKRYGEVF